MMDMIDDDFSWLAAVMHFSDGVLPVGAYAHSLGLEGVVQTGMVKSGDELETFLLRDVSDSLLWVDVPLVAHAWRACESGQLALLHELDELCWAARPARQLRESASKIGRQQWRVYQQTWARDAGLPDIDWVYHQSPVVLGCLMHHQGAPVAAACWSFVYQTYSAFLQAALKLLPIGPRLTQEVLQRALREIRPQLAEAMHRELDEIGSFNPVWDLAAAQHEGAKARMFIS
ncbi:urease accessory protein UreF [Persicirhabdus sediminis]|nr:urease accessory UreF family protein [Persicirhabdus sediminis]